jgi:hypothetical protein
LCRFWVSIVSPHTYWRGEWGDGERLARGKIYDCPPAAWEGAGRNLSRRRGRWCSALRGAGCGVLAVAPCGGLGPGTHRAVEGKKFGDKPLEDPGGGQHTEVEGANHK